jgi:ATP-dependent DNA helicase RecG
MISLDTPVAEVKGIGPQYQERLSRLGIRKVKDLLYHFPRRYSDFSRIVPIAHAHSGEVIAVKGEVKDIANKKTRTRGMVLTEAVIADDSGSLKALWFNQPFLTTAFKKGTRVILAGKFEWQYGTLGLHNPVYERASSDPKHAGRIVPVYPETEGLSSRWLRARIKPLLFLTKEIGDFLPERVRNRQDLLALSQALHEIHFPSSSNALEKARERLSFDELFLLQLSRLRSKVQLQKEAAPSIKYDQELGPSFVSSLRFELTKAQKKAAWEILRDMEKTAPINRLLEGDVGSGKTVVAAFAMLMAVYRGYQAALMCPTEVLAKQHYQRVTELLKHFDVKVSLLISSMKEQEKAAVVEQSHNGEAQVVIGTHALIQENLRFKNLGLAVIDEQHRFGVKQRQALRERNAADTMPHFLSMSATPIPRTLALTLYGDLDISVIDEMPPGRQKVITRLVPPGKRREAYDSVRAEISKGRQAFVICPIIEETDKLGVNSATQEYEKLSGEVFPELRIGLLHGRMKPAEKDATMAGFVEGRIDLLVSTSVVEVGVDVPNATIMVIEGAERFGLAQLHQFRGRVGRGEHQSYCLLFTESRADLSLKRLRALVNIDDGFKLAQVDLELRGPGELYGTMQHGIPDFKMASLLDAKLIKRTREEAEGIIGQDPDLKTAPLLARRLEEMESSYHAE